MKTKTLYKTKTIYQTGITIKGSALIHLWGGGTGHIAMTSKFIPLDKISKDNIQGCVNDGRFGCESIEEAEIDIYIKYDNGSIEYERTLFSGPIHSSLAFRGIAEPKNLTS